MCLSTKKDVVKRKSLEVYYGRVTLEHDNDSGWRLEATEQKPLKGARAS